MFSCGITWVDESDELQVMHPSEFTSVTVINYPVIETGDVHLD